MNDPTRILGIDPGSRITGYGIIDTDGTATRYVASGCLNLGDGDFSGRLREIYSRISGLVDEYTPDHIAIEQIFVHKNADSALKLGHARAAAICATFASRSTLNGPALHEYAAREVKQAIVGKGSAAKDQVQHMVRILLNLGGEHAEMGTDASDALGIALCHAHTRNLVERYAEVMP